MLISMLALRWDCDTMVMLVNSLEHSWSQAAPGLAGNDPTNWDDLLQKVQV